MDTILYPAYNRTIVERTATSAAGIGIALCLLVSQNMFITAHGTNFNFNEEAKKSKYTVEDVSKDIEKNFDREVNYKYSGSKITTIDKGVKHVKMIRFYNGRPVRINIVELSKGVNGDLDVVPAIATDKLAGKSKISNIAERENAIAAINGGYFKPQTGVPLGTLMINKKVYTGPIYDRVAMGIFDNGYEMARVQLKATIETNLGGIKIDNINQPRMLSTYTLVYTPDWGTTAPPCPKYGKAIAISDGKLVKSSYGQLAIPTDGFVVVAPEKEINKIVNAKRFKLNIKINPEWKNVNHIISGGPYLVKGGDIYVDMTAQKLGSIGGRNPRTAIGYTKDNHLIMLTADGREGSSVGLTLMELAYLMKELGCVYAMNLDGGGSTVMYVNGHVVNKPHVQGGIPLSHTLTVTKRIS